MFLKLYTPIIKKYIRLSSPVGPEQSTAPRKQRSAEIFLNKKQKILFPVTKEDNLQNKSRGD